MTWCNTLLHNMTISILPPVHYHPQYNKTPSSDKRDCESTKPESY